MIHINYNIAFVSFFQIKNSFNGASEVSLSLYQSLKCKKKKLFEIKNLEFIENNINIFHFTNIFFIKPIKIIQQIFLVKAFFRNKLKKIIIIEGASWVGYSFFFIKIIQILVKDAIIIYHAHNIEYEIRKIKSSKIILLLTKYFEKKIYNETKYSTVVSKIDQLKIRKLYNVKPIIFNNGICKKRIFCTSRINNYKNKKYIIFSGNYFYPPNKYAIDNLVNYILPDINKKYKNIKLVITGSEIPEKIINKKNVIFKKNIKKSKLNYLLKNSICSILPMYKSPGTKLKIIEALLLGVIIITNKKTFSGIEIVDKNPPFFYKKNKEITKILTKIIKTKLYSIKAKKNSLIYKKKYLMENILENFIKNDFKKI